MALSQKKVSDLPKFLKIKPISHDALEKMGFSWNKDGDGEYIVRDKFVLISQEEANNYLNATNELYKMYESGAEYVMKHSLFDVLDIPPSLVSQIKYTWENERENHLYGRFDLIGGIDDKHKKLI